MAAHASCADAALADDHHWDAIASREPEAGDEEPQRDAAPAERGRGAGCLSVLPMGIALAIIAAVVTLAL